MILSPYDNNGVRGAVAADTEWDGSAGDGSWDTAANWTSGAVPSNSVNVRLSTTDDDITTGLGQSLITVDSLNIGEGHTGNLASDASPLQINADTVRIRKRLGTVNMTGKYRLVVIYSTTPGSLSVTLGGTIDTLVVHAGIGEVKVEASSVLNTLVAGIGGETTRAAEITLGANITNNDPTASSTYIRRIVARGPVSIVSESGCEDLDVSNGAYAEFTGDAAHLNVQARREGVVTHLASGKIDGRLTVTSQGVFRMWGNENVGVQIDDATIVGGVMDLRTGGDPVTITNDIDVEGAGIVRYSPESLLTPSPAYGSGFSSGFGPGPSGSGFDSGFGSGHE